MERTRFVTDGRTDGRTHGEKQYVSRPFGGRGWGGHKCAMHTAGHTIDFLSTASN